MNIMRIWIIFIAVLVVMTGSSRGQFEGAVWEILTSDSLPHTLSRKPIGATPTGFHITYSKSRGSGNGWKIYYRFLSYYGGWDEPVIVDQIHPAFEPSIAAREFGAYRIGIFYDVAGDIYGDIVSSPWDPWSPSNLTYTADADYSVTADIDMNGQAHLAWITELAGEYKIAYGTMWEDSLDFEVIMNSELGDFGSGAAPGIVTIDSLPHLFYRGVSGFNYRIHHAYKTSTDSSWIIEQLFTPNVDDYTASAALDTAGNIHLSISGNMGWGMPGHIYYLKRFGQTGDWSIPELASGTYSVVDGNIGITEDGVVFIAGAGVSGNIYTGDIYLCDNSGGSFVAELLVNYPDGITPALGFLPGPVGALIMQGRISHPGYENAEIIYFGPGQTGADWIPKIPSLSISVNNYPNPFNSQTIIRVTGFSDAETRLDIYDLLGRKIDRLSPYVENENGLFFRWRGLNGNGRDCPSGNYYYIVSGGTGKAAGRMTYLK